MPAETPHRTSRSRAESDPIALLARAKAEIDTRIADTRLTPAALICALKTTDGRLRRALADAGGFRVIVTAARLDAALLSLASRPPFLGIVGDFALAHGYARPETFSDAFTKRFGYRPVEVLTMRSVWPPAQFQTWLRTQADRYGFGARLDSVCVERRPMVRLGKERRP